MHEAAHNLTREELQGCLNDFSNISNRMAWSNMPSSRPKVMPNAWAELSNSMIHACKKYGIPVPYWLGDDDEEEVRKGVTLLIHTHPAPTERILTVDEVLEVCKGRKHGTETPAMDFGEGGHARHDVSSEARDDHGRWTEGGGTKEEEPSEDEVKAYRSMQPKNKEAKAKYWKKHEETFYPWMDAEKRHDEAHGKLRAEFDALPDKEKEERLDEFKKRSADLWEEKEKFVRPHREALAAYERLSDGESTAEEEDIHAGHVIRDRRTDPVEVVGHTGGDGKVVMRGEPVKEEDLPHPQDIKKMINDLPVGDPRNIHGTVIEKMHQTGTGKNTEYTFQINNEDGRWARTETATAIILKNLQEGNVVKPESSPFKKDNAPQVAAPTLGKTTSVLLNLGEVKGKDLLLPGFEEYHLVAVPPGGSVAKHTKTGWEIYEKTTGLPVYRDTYSANHESQFHNAASMAHQILSMKGKKKLDAAIVQFQRPGQQS